MINLSLLISDSEVVGPGGLFDFDATLPLVMVQFLVLIFILNTVLYKPLLATIDERKDYVLNILSKAVELVSQTNELITQYEEKLNTVRKQVQLEITNSQKIHKDQFESRLTEAQEKLNNTLSEEMADLSKNKKLALDSLDPVVQNLCRDIETILLI